MNCGSEFAVDVKFCPSCGTPITLSRQTVKESDVASEKTKAPKKTSPKLIAIAMLIIVFIGGATLGAALTRHAATTTVTPTLQTQSTMTQAIDVTAYLTSMRAILDEARNMTGMWIAKHEAFMNGQLSKADFIAFEQAQEDSSNRLIESAIRLRPPSAYVEVHVHFVKALSLDYVALRLDEDGLIQNNASLIDESTKFDNESDNEIKTGISILQSLNPQQTPTATQAADVAKYTSAMKAIFLELSDISSKSADNMRAFSNHQISSTDLVAFIREQKNNIERLWESALRLQPPPALSEAHLHYVKSMAFEYEASTLYEDGLIQNNIASLFAEGNAFATQSQNEIKTGNTIMDSLISQHSTTVMVQTIQMSQSQVELDYLSNKYGGLLKSVGSLLFSLALETLTASCGSVASGDFMIGYCHVNDSNGIVWNYLHGPRGVGMTVLVDYPNAVGTWQSIQGAPQFSKSSTTPFPVKMNGVFGHAYVFVQQASG